MKMTDRQIAAKVRQYFATIQNEEQAAMADKTKTPSAKRKRLSKSDRTHQRRLKQAARKPGGVPG